MLRFERGDDGEIRRRAAAATITGAVSMRGSDAVRSSAARPGGALGAGQRDAVPHVDRRRIAARRRPRRRRDAAARASPIAVAVGRASARTTRAAAKAALAQRRIGGEAVAGAGPAAAVAAASPSAGADTAGATASCQRVAVMPVSGDIDLAHARVEARDDARPPRAAAAPSRPAPRASRRRSPGSPAPSARPCATPHAMRTPVNAPGPAPNAMPSSCASVTPASASSAADHRQQRFGVAVPATSERSSQASAVAERDAQVSVEVSRARIRIGAFYRARGYAMSRTAAPVQCAIYSAFGAARRMNHGPSSPRSTRKAAASRASTARRCSSKARCPASASTIEIYRKRKPTYELARATGDPARQPFARRAALPAFRRLRRLQPAASATRRRRSRPSSACSRTRSGTSGACAPEQLLRADPRSGVGLPAARAAVGAPRRQERRRAGRLPRAEVELRRRHARCHVLPPQISALLPALRALIGGAVDARPPAADRARGRRRRGRRHRRTKCWCCASSTPLDGRRRARSCATFADRHGVRALPAAGRTRHRAAVPSAGAAPCATRCPSSASRIAVSADRLHAGQRRDQSRAGAPRGRRCSSRDAGRAHRRFLLRPRQFHAADRAARRATSSASKAAPRWCGARKPTRERNGLARSCALRRRRTCSRPRRRASRRWARSTRR